MAYTTPVYDRSQSDILAQNSKAYLNVADWTRIYNNAVFVSGLFTSEIGYTPTFNTQSLPTTVTVFTKSQLNLVLANIERMRLWGYNYLGSYIFPDALFVEIKDDWDEGHQVSAPNFSHVNSWEYVLDVLYNILNSWTPPTISGDLELFGGGGYVELIGGGNFELIG